MNPFFLNKKLLGIVVSIIALGSLLAISMGVGSTFITQGVNDVTSILGRAVAYPTNSMKDFIEDIQEISDIYAENQELKQKIEAVYELEVKLHDLKNDNEKMKETLDLQDTLNDYSLINASVIARNPDSWTDMLTINKGSMDGIEKNMSVMSGNGLIGKVFDVNATSSRVVLLSNSDTTLIRVAAMIQTDSEPIYGIITGYDFELDQLIMSQIKANQDIQIGNKVVTSGLGGMSPSSLYIGIVEEVSMDRQGLYKEVKIKPAADTNDIRYVTVVRRLSEGGE